MTDSRQHDEWQGAQPGLEVVPQERLQGIQAWPEVRETHHIDVKEVAVTQYSAASSQTDGYGYYSASPLPQYVPPPHESPLARSRRRWLMIGGVAAAVVIVGAILGGVLGSRARNGSTTSEQTQGGAGDVGAGAEPGGGTTVNETSTAGRPDSPAQLKSLRLGSALAVTGMRKVDGSLDLFLFYQDYEDRLRYSRCDTSRPGENGTCWSSSISFQAVSAQPGAQLSASSLLFGTRQNPQTELFYSGVNSRLYGANFNSLTTGLVDEDSVNTMDISTGTNSSLAAYWPWTIYQDTAGELHHVRNRLFANWSPASQWDNNKIGISALAGSKLAIVPMSANFTRIALKGGYAVFYQGPDGRLSVAIPDLNNPGLDPTYSLSWPTTLPSITLPKLAPIAAFSAARPSDAQQRVNTYVLYRDGTTINMLYTDGTNWKTSQPAALKGVDPDTGIACLTMATSPNPERLLEPVSEGTNLCYFQKDGGLVEVKMVGVDWVVTGKVPLL